MYCNDISLVYPMCIFDLYPYFQLVLGSNLASFCSPFLPSTRRNADQQDAHLYDSLLTQQFQIHKNSHYKFSKNLNPSAMGMILLKDTLLLKQSVGNVLSLLMLCGRNVPVIHPR